jgi:hypothetical protein
VAYATIDELAAALRTPVTPDNTAILQRCLDAAALEIDDALCRPADDPVDPLDPLVHSVNLMRGVEWWKANDAAFGFLGSGEDALRLPRSTFARHAAALTPARRAWGIA